MFIHTIKAFCLATLLLVLAPQNFAKANGQPPNHEANPSEYLRALSHNLAQSRSFAQRDQGLVRYIGDYERFAYVLLTASDYENSEYRKIREDIARNLPAGVKLVVLTDTFAVESVKARYSKWISEDRLVIAVARDASQGFWARDSFPLPVLNQSNEISLVAHRYYRPFSAHKAVANSVSAKELLPKSFTFVGGNLIADEFGNCFSVKSDRLFGITSEELKNAYACKTHTMLPWLAGIGDVDEVIKPLANRQMLTTHDEYRPLLESLGYRVSLLPKALGGNYRTYANALLVNGVAFMPSFATANDNAAKAVYEQFGYRVVMIRTNNMSDTMRGSVHCQTMAYPKMNLEDLFSRLGARRVY